MSTFSRRRFFVLFYTRPLKYIGLGVVTALRFGRHFFAKAQKCLDAFVVRRLGVNA